MKPLYAIAVVCLTLLFTSCDKKETVPGYLKIDSITFSGDPATQGTNSQNITEAWVFIDDDLQGVYSLPCDVPILALGQHEVKIRGGIKKNGIGTERTDYPFFNTFEQTVNFESLKDISIQPLVNYNTDVAMFHEEFEDAGIRVYTGSTSDTTVNLTTDKDKVFEGNGSARLFLQNDNTFGILYTNEKKFLPIGQPVFLEVNYKTDDYMTIGIVTHLIGGSDIFKEIIFVKPSSESATAKGGWNKIYVNLSEQVNKANAGSTFDIYFSMTRSAGKSSSELLFDNIKIIHPKF